MNNYNLHFLVCNNLNLININIKIYAENNLIYNNNHTNLDTIKINLYPNKIYYLKINNHPHLFPFIVSNNKNLYLPLYKLNTLITLKLTDKNYRNLPIKKGELILNAT